MEINFTTRFVQLPAEPAARTLPRRAASSGGNIAPYPYRDQGAWLQRFSQHVSIAVELSRELTPIRDRFERAVGANGSAEAAATIAQEIGSRWEMLWSQLDDAATLAQASGADVGAYDKARSDAGDLTSGAAVVEISDWEDDGTTRGRMRTAQYRLPRLETARRALGALRAAVPAAQIVRQPDAPDLRPLSQRIPWTWIAVGVVVAAAILHFL